jgi:hypothetical protein
MDVPRRPKARLYHLDNIPDKILCTHARKRYRRRCTKQIDLKMLAIYEWLKNPELYRKFHKPIFEETEDDNGKTKNRRAGKDDHTVTEF